MNSKRCCKCNEEKELSNFSKDGYRNDGLDNKCKLCKSVYKKDYYSKNKEKLREYGRGYKNKADCNSRCNRKEYSSRYYQENKEKIKANKKARYLKNKVAMSKAKKVRLESDPIYKLSCNLRTRTCAAFRGVGHSKNTKTIRILGIDWEIVKAYIQRQFTEGMTWDNYGEWQIDHIVPLSSATTEDEVIYLCHYRNLQPLWAKDNREKKDKIPNFQLYLPV